MAEPNSQHLCNRVIDAVERAEMSRRAATRRHEIGESVAIKWLERVERDGPRRSARRMRRGEPSRAWRARLRADCVPAGFLGGTSRWTLSDDLEP